MAIITTVPDYTNSVTEIYYTNKLVYIGKSNI